MSEPGPPKNAILRTNPPDRATRHAAALVCASRALDDPEPEASLTELLDLLGLYETVGEP